MGRRTLIEIAESLELTVHCNCDLDNWQPTKSTGHSPVCRIHKMESDQYRAALKDHPNE